MRIEQRVRKAEERLNLRREPIVCRIVLYGGGPLPPEKRCGNIVIRYVRYEDREEAKNET